MIIFQNKQKTTRLKSVASRWRGESIDPVRPAAVLFTHTCSTHTHNRRRRLTAAIATIVEPERRFDSVRSSRPRRLSVVVTRVSDTHCGKIKERKYKRKKYK